MTRIFEYASEATQGARRYQEDCAAVHSPGGQWPPLDLASVAGADNIPPLQSRGLVVVLADGMGGHAGGGVASRIACEAFLSAETAERGPPGTTPVHELLDSLDAANAAIAHRVAEQPMFSGMGTTLIGATLGVAGLEWISVGDSLLYLWRAGALRRLNADHSLAPEIDKLAEAGKISWEKALADPRRHYLRSAVTGDDLDLIDRAPAPLALEAGDIVLIATDGIHTLEEIQIERIIARHANPPAHADPSPRGRCAAIAHELLARVEAAGDENQDNTTVVVVRVDERA